ncbi:apolipoprotein N-acyltransferase [Corynebacterium mayonis]|uniref:apolipoprotein N-acyltransferase n=1 Tax=Corynebacterium mayonis TaxID=3062461 RepID=UPI00314015F1
MLLLFRIALAALSGKLVFYSYEPHGMWWLGIVGLALFVASLAPWPLGLRVSVKAGALLGFTHSFFLFLFMLPWIGEFVGWQPYVALSFFLALYGIPVGAFGAVLARHNRALLAFPFVYVAWEFLRSTLPFGGFPWGRLAWGQIEGPLRHLAAWGGPALVTFATVSTAVGLVALLAYRRPFGAAFFVFPVVAAFVAGAMHTDRDDGAVTVSAVQGNVPRLGLDFNAQRRAVLTNHTQETKRLAESGARPDFVVWPENAADVSPFTDSFAAALVDEALHAVNVPILVGTLTRDEVGARNTMAVFDPDSGPGDYHHKKYLQPFGEYMPMRDFFRLFSDLVDQAGNFQPGDGNSVVDIAGVRLGIATCYEVAVDAAYRTAVTHGAKILATPTNNATFGFTDMTYQQMAMSRMRAIETDRAVVVAATSGASGIIRPDGTVTQQTGIFEAGHLTETLPLRSTVTPAVRFGTQLQWLLVAGGVAVMLATLLRRRGGYAAMETTSNA